MIGSHLTYTISTEFPILSHLANLGANLNQALTPHITCHTEAAEEVPAAAVMVAEEASEGAQRGPMVVAINEAATATTNGHVFKLISIHQIQFQLARFRTLLTTR